MKVYARILEAGGRGIVNFPKVATVTVYGQPTGTGCWNHPGVHRLLARDGRGPVPELRRSTAFSGAPSARARWRTSCRTATTTARPASASSAARAARPPGSIPSARARASRTSSRTCRVCADRPAEAGRRRRRGVPSHPAALSRSARLGLPVPSLARSGDEDDVRPGEGDQAVGAGGLARRSLGDVDGHHRALRDELRRHGAVVGLPEGRRVPRRHRAARAHVGRRTCSAAC